MATTLRWKDEKKWTRRIAKEPEVSRSSQIFGQKYQETGTVHDRPSSGRKRKLSILEVKKLIKRTKSGKSALAIAGEISESKERKTEKAHHSSSRVMSQDHKWTVNWKFVDEDIFLSSEFAKTLLLGHAAVLAMFLFIWWCRYRIKGFFKIISF